MSWFQDLFGGEKETTQTVQKDIRQMPDYAESEGARGKWWQTLQDWGGQPGYGAIAPNWGDIWNNARSKLTRQYWGGPEGPGAVAKVKSSAARRGVSDSPALQTTIGRMGMQEGNQLMDMAIQQAMAEANFGEQGRKTWMSSLQNLAGLKPQFMDFGGTSTSTEKTNPISDLIGGFGSNMMSGGGAEDTTDWYTQMLDMMNGAGGGMSGISGGSDPFSGSGGMSGLGKSDDEGYDLLGAIMGTGRGLMGDPTGWAQLAGTFF